ncbi:FRG domain-containing protein [Culicoidibacter larvae]|uniref:FRG domain-containing protein n=1 Tax=Culicoidibacter larvae TaxID=2579976 RepID=A0A5R8QCZ8_9FIRM|nr:FRG domain-containing protein [Culicoidibacter larvae]TLG73853.1 FRG domain-containing protein [Culicoidibacter larvae]
MKKYIKELNLLCEEVRFNYNKNIKAQIIQMIQTIISEYALTGIRKEKFELIITLLDDCTTKEEINDQLLLAIKLSNSEYKIPIISSVQEYIAVIKDICSNYRVNQEMCLFRGEAQTFDIPMQPNIFRNGQLNISNTFEQELFYQLKTYNILRQHREDDFLEGAIQAQHGGFGSRLLDISYNCLIALYFACEFGFDNTNLNNWIDNLGHVFVFNFPKIFNPGAKEIQSFYKNIISNNNILDMPLFNRNVKILSHSKVNERVVSQYGGFILFPSMNYIPIDSAHYKHIYINTDKKKEILEDLQFLFGIHKGTIYPETENMVKWIQEQTEKSNVDLKINFAYELDASFDLFQRELDAIYDEAEDDILRQIENLLQKYLDDIEYSIPQIGKVISTEEQLILLFVYMKNILLEIYNCRLNNVNIYMELFHPKVETIIKKVDKSVKIENDTEIRLIKKEINKIFEEIYYE